MPDKQQETMKIYFVEVVRAIRRVDTVVMQFAAATDCRRPHCAGLDLLDELASRFELLLGHVESGVSGRHASARGSQLSLQGINLGLLPLNDLP
jgi:hypothetical protein